MVRLAFTEPFSTLKDLESLSSVDACRWNWAAAGLTFAGRCTVWNERIRNRDTSGLAFAKWFAGDVGNRAMVRLAFTEPFSTLKDLESVSSVDVCRWKWDAAGLTFAGRCTVWIDNISNRDFSRIAFAECSGKSVFVVTFSVLTIVWRSKAIVRRWNRGGLAFAGRWTIGFEITWIRDASGLAIARWLNDGVRNWVTVELTFAEPCPLSCRDFWGISDGEVICISGDPEDTNSGNGRIRTSWRFTDCDIINGGATDGLETCGGLDVIPVDPENDFSETSLISDEVERARRESSGWFDVGTILLVDNDELILLHESLSNFKKSSSERSFESSVLLFISCCSNFDDGWIACRWNRAALELAFACWCTNFGGIIWNRVASGLAIADRSDDGVRNRATDGPAFAEPCPIRWGASCRDSTDEIEAFWVCDGRDVDSTNPETDVLMTWRCCSEVLPAGFENSTEGVSVGRSMLDGNDAIILVLGGLTANFVPTFFEWTCRKLTRNGDSNRRTCRIKCS